MVCHVGQQCQVMVYMCVGFTFNNNERHTSWMRKPLQNQKRLSTTQQSMLFFILLVHLFTC